MQIHIFVMCVNSYQRGNTFFIFYMVVAYVRGLGGQQVYIYFHKIILYVCRPKMHTLWMKGYSLDVSRVTKHTYMCYGLQLHVQHEFCIFVLKS